MPEPISYDSKLKGPWYASVFNGNFGVRFGPLNGPAVGRVIQQCVDEQIPLVLTLDGGPEFDLDLARDVRGWSDELAKENATPGPAALADQAEG